MKSQELFDKQTIRDFIDKPENGLLRKIYIEALPLDYHSENFPIGAHIRDGILVFNLYNNDSSLDKGYNAEICISKSSLEINNLTQIHAGKEDSFDSIKDAKSFESKFKSLFKRYKIYEYIDPIMFDLYMTILNIAVVYTAMQSDSFMEDATFDAKVNVIYVDDTSSKSIVTQVRDSYTGYNVQAVLQFKV